METNNLDFGHPCTDLVQFDGFLNPRQPFALAWRVLFLLRTIVNLCNEFPTRRSLIFSSGDDSFSKLYARIFI